MSRFYEPVEVSQRPKAVATWRGEKSSQDDIVFQYPGSVFIEHACCWIITPGTMGYLCSILERDDGTSGFIHPLEPHAEPEGIVIGGFTLSTNHKLVFRFYRADTGARYAVIVTYRVIA